MGKPGLRCIPCVQEDTASRTKQAAAAEDDVRCGKKGKMLHRLVSEERGNVYFKASVAVSFHTSLAGLDSGTYCPAVPLRMLRSGTLQPRTRAPHTMHRLTPL